MHEPTRTGVLKGQGRRLHTYMCRVYNKNNYYYIYIHTLTECVNITEDTSILS